MGEKKPDTKSTHAKVVTTLPCLRLLANALHCLFLKNNENLKLHGNFRRKLFQEKLSLRSSYNIIIDLRLRHHIVHNLRTREKIAGERKSTISTASNRFFQQHSRRRGRALGSVHAKTTSSRAKSKPRFRRSQPFTESRPKWARHFRQDCVAQRVNSHRESSRTSHARTTTTSRRDSWSWRVHSGGGET